MKPVKNRFFFYTLAIPAFVAMVVNFSIASNTHRGHSFDLCCPDPIHSVDLLPHCLDGCPR